MRSLNAIGRIPLEEAIAALTRMWGTGELQHVMNPDMPWNEEIRAAWARFERLAASPRTVAVMMPLVTEMNVRAVLPAIRVPALVLQHADDPFVPPAQWASTSPTTSRARNTLSSPGATSTTFVEPMARVLSGDRRVPHRPAGRCGR